MAQPSSPNTAGTLAAIDADRLRSLIESDKPLRVPAGRRLIVRGDLDLDALTYSHKLVLSCCTFKGRVQAREARFLKSVDLSDCRFEGGLSFNGAHVGGSLTLDGAEVSAPREGAGPADFRSLRVEGDLTATGLQAEAGLDLTNVRVGGELRLEGAHVAGDLDLMNAKVGGGLFGGPGRAGSPGITVAGELRLAAAEVAAMVDLRRARLGSLNLAVAVVDGFLKCDHAQVGQPPPADAGDGRGAVELRLTRLEEGDGAEDADRCASAHGGECLKDPLDRVPGQANLSGTLVADQASFTGAAVEGPLSLQNAELRSDLVGNGLTVGGPLVLEMARVAGNVQLANGWLCGGGRMYGARIEGDLGLSGATVRGGLDLRNAALRRLGCEAGRAGDGAPTTIHGGVNVSTATLTGGLHFQRARVLGDVLVEDTRVSGEVNFTGATVTGALKVECSTITGRVKFSALDEEERKKAVAQGGPADEARELLRVGKGLSLADSRVQSDVLLEGVQVEDGNLVVEEAVIEGDLSCRYAAIRRGEGRKPQEAEEAGNGRFEGVKVTGLLRLLGARFDGKLFLNRAAIEGKLECNLGRAPRTVIGETLSLTTCRARHADFDAKPKSPAPGAPVKDWAPRRVYMSGFDFEELHVPGGDYVALLARTDPFYKSAYVAVEKWLRNRDEEDEANRVYRAMRRHRRREMTRGRWPLSPRWFVGWFRRLFDLLADTFIQIAVRTYRLLVLYLLAALLVTGLLFADPESVSLKGTAGAPPDLAVAPPPQDWNVMKSILMSVQVNLPVVPVQAVDQYQPSSRPLPALAWTDLRISYSDYAACVSVLSGLAVAFLAGGVSNKLSRRRASEA